MPDKHTLSAQPQVRYLDLLARAVAYIGEHLAEPLSNETLAAQAAMSPFHFHRLFRAHVGTTVAGYVTWRRLQRACELLADERAVVLDVALVVGYDSAQALAKAMRRELDTTPTAVRAGAAPRWQQLYERRGQPTGPDPDTPSVALQPRLVDLPEQPVLTATGRGMHEGRMARAAEQAAAELWGAIAQAGFAERVTLSVGILPDEPEHSEDPQVRIWIGAGFGAARPPIVLQGSLAWRALQGGRYAVFNHLGPYDGLHRTWAAIYGQWLPAMGYALRDVPPFEHYLNDPRTLPPEQWRTDLHVPLR
ncbi:MAG TPA: AraC family transcriptional regulator [Rhizobacter sp.]|nr:AraC family transcriptional regulator [Rhizobacter sp.]